MGNGERHAHIYYASRATISRQPEFSSKELWVKASPEGGTSDDVISMGMERATHIFISFRKCTHLDNKLYEQIATCTSFPFFLSYWFLLIQSLTVKHTGPRRATLIFSSQAKDHMETNG